NDLWVNYPGFATDKRVQKGHTAVREAGKVDKAGLELGKGGFDAEFGVVDNVESGEYDEVGILVRGKICGDGLELFEQDFALFGGGESKKTHDYSGALLAECNVLYIFLEQFDKLFNFG